MSLRQALDLTSHERQATQTRHRAPNIKVSWVALEEGSSYAENDYDHVTGIDDLLDGETADVVIVDGPQDATAEALASLRQNQSYANRLILLGRPGNQQAEALADGVAPSQAIEIAKQWSDWNARLERLAGTNKEADAWWAVDQWLLLRPDAWIKPISDPAHRNLYTYPLLDALLNETVSDGLSLLENRWNLGDYERGPLVDRIRSCRECNSSHINYVDVCSQCRSLEIARQPCLHCFICGNVDRQQHFSKNDGLRCPNCLTKLRHIGTDYDRPLENYQCHSCQNLFIDASVEARCLSCGHRHETDELRAREIRPFRLNEAGRLKRLNGNYRAQSTQTTDRRDPRLVTKEQFADLVNWQINVHALTQQAAAYTSLSPALVAVRLDLEIQPDLENIPRDQLDRWMTSLVEALATSERAVREHDNMIWILRPHCRSHDIETFHKYLVNHLQSKHPNDRHPIRVQTKGYLLNKNINPQDDAELLQARLLSELTEQASSQH